MPNKTFFQCEEELNKRSYPLNRIEAGPQLLL